MVLVMCFENENEGRRTARQFVDRELNSGKKVIILGNIEIL